MSLASQPANLLVGTVTIGSGASLSDALDIRGQPVVAIRMPAAWTAAQLTFQASHDNTNWFNVFDRFGNELSALVDISRWVTFDPADLCAVRFIRVRSGTSGTPVNQGAARTLELIVRVIDTRV